MDWFEIPGAGRSHEIHINALSKTGFDSFPCSNYISVLMEVQVFLNKL